MTDFHTILCPTDFSQPAEMALQAARELGRSAKRIVVLHVTPPPSGALETAIDELKPLRQRQLLEAELRRWSGDHDLNVQVDYRVMESSEPADAIVQVARNEPCNLIVMGTRGRTGLPRMLLGSVAAKVMRDAPCPVVVVKGPSSPVSKRPPENSDSPTPLVSGLSS